MASCRPWTGTMPVAFLLSHDDSHTRRILSVRRPSTKQCLSDRPAIELLALARSEQDVGQILQDLLFPGVAAQSPFAWVDHASAAIVSAAVRQYVINEAWTPALYVLERAIRADAQVSKSFCLACSCAVALDRHEPASQWINTGLPCNRV